MCLLFRSNLPIPGSGRGRPRGSALVDAACARRTLFAGSHRFTGRLYPHVTCAVWMCHATPSNRRHEYVLLCSLRPLIMRVPRYVFEDLQHCGGGVVVVRAHQLRVTSQAHSLFPSPVRSQGGGGGEFLPPNMPLRFLCASPPSITRARVRLLYIRYLTFCGLLI